MLKCVSLIIFVCSILDVTKSRYTRRYSWPEKKFRCTNNQLYKENFCNYCTCRNNELISCTLMLCTGEKYYLAKNCRIGTKTTQDCNGCECVEGIGTICTVKECLPKGDEHPCRCKPCMPCKCPCDFVEPETTESSNPACTYPPGDFDYYGDKKDDDHRPDSPDDYDQRPSSPDDYDQRPGSPDDYDQPPSSPDDYDQRPGSSDDYDVGNDDQRSWPISCPLCPACAPCDCSHCKGTPDSGDDSNPGCTYPPEIYDYYDDKN
ncbi:hypothetical protein ILUMI_02989 [Ignelater luminosus]|uniref:VWFC domain-containing protein n=1 Tax=Ignelater luminosus TaxID=2038154 RepID=A0A8K0DHC0_IGNLU|nr:hypothetical protein ILUMI_02989 [Ignelater luminosus]